MLTSSCPSLIHLSSLFHLSKATTPARSGPSLGVLMRHPPITVPPPPALLSQRAQLRSLLWRFSPIIICSRTVQRWAAICRCADAPAGMLAQLQPT